MGSNNKKNDPNASGGDPRGRTQNQSAHQVQRYEGQIDPVLQQMGTNFGRGSEANYGDYTDIMNQYRGIASGAGGAAGGGGGGGGAAGWNPSLIGYNDPFKSYGGYTEFSETGGYSPNDISNMRARGISPVRAAYANAEREVGRQRALQGGYSPNAIATQARMAREQGQAAADATQGVEAGLAQARNQGKLAGLGGMSEIEKQRLAADLDVSKFNAQAQMQAAASNAGASNAANQASMRDRLSALQGMTSLYGATPGMAELFGNQLLAGTGQSGDFGVNMMGRDIESQRLPGQYEQTMGRVNDIGGMITNAAYPLIDAWKKRQQPMPRQTNEEV